MHKSRDGRKSAVLRFVAATDFSQHALWAAQRALKALRELLRAKPKGVAKLLHDVRQALTEAAAALAKYAGASVSPRVAIGEVLDVITQECNRADLLVLGARGANPLRDIGLDFAPASEDALRKALRLAPQAAVIAVHAYEVPFEGKLRLAGVERGTIDAYRYRAAEKAIAEIRTVGERAAGERTRVGHKVGYGYAPHLILKQEQLRRADLIALGKHKRPRMQEFLLGRVTRHVLADSRSDVLVVPA